MILTKSSMFIIGPVASLLGYLMDAIYNFLELIGIPNIGLSIILFTLIIYLLLMPLTYKQQKFSKLSAKMNPELQAIQKKYKGKNDNNSVMATNEFFENHPDAKDKFNIYTLDSKTYSGGYGYPVIEAGKKAKKGQSAKSIVSFLKDWFDNGVTYFGMYTLQYAKKSGRIPSAAAFVGEVMGLRPIMKIENNEIVTANKVRGDKAIIPKILECCEKEMIPKTPYCVMYGSDKAVGDEMAQAMTKAVGYPPSEMIQIGAAIAINAGPKVVSVVIKAQK